MHSDLSIVEQFWRNVVAGQDENDCWGWTGVFRQDGTAIIPIRGSKGRLLASRVSWIINFGDISDRTRVRRRCGNKFCTNPLHLELFSGDAEKDRFWKRVDVINDADSCWEWKGKVGPTGYGRLKANGRELRAHRYAYELEYGSIPNGLFILHKCDNRRCCRPSHLSIGSTQDNMDDMKRKGRQAKWEGHGMAKLTWEQVMEIRRKLSNGSKGIDLRVEYGISMTAISNIKLNKTWRE